jgi:branched-chain amino acid transport system substrate-binding protein
MIAAALMWPVADGLGSRAGGVQPVSTSFCSPVRSGAAKPQFVITSDLPASGSQTRPYVLAMQDAILFILERDGFKAGSYSVGYQACDDASPQQGGGDLGKCAANAKAYAADPSVIAVIGTLYSVCAEVELPILDRAPNGPLALVSPSNTDVGMTHAGATTNPGQPTEYYPAGIRNFVRIAAPDDVQGTADALLAKQLGVHRVFVLNDGEFYGRTVVPPFEDAARGYGLKIAGTASWRVNQTRFEALAKRVARSGADGVFLGGYACPGCGTLVRELRAAVGPHVAIIAPDGFTPLPATIKATGAKGAEGLYVSEIGMPASGFGPLGRKIAKMFTPSEPDSGGSGYAAEAAQVLVDAIAASNGTRADVTKHLFAVHEGGAIVKNLGFDGDGDPTVNPFTIVRVHNGKARFNRIISPPPSRAR